mmetsp:Transcript_16403/g.33695  ORF Transcript_16403/g.33695 Transcript_16403/m.33695 type:complete len:277 (-) Transcript_16403:1112-1942(-)
MGRLRELQAPIEAAAGVRAAGGHRHPHSLYLLVLDGPGSRLSLAGDYRPGGSQSGASGRNRGTGGGNNNNNNNTGMGGVCPREQIFAAGDARLVGADGTLCDARLERDHLLHLAAGEKGRKTPQPGGIPEPAPAQLQLLCGPAGGNAPGRNFRRVFPPVDGGRLRGCLRRLYVAHGEVLFRKQNRRSPVHLLVHGHDSRKNDDDGAGGAAVCSHSVLCHVFLCGRDVSGKRKRRCRPPEPPGERCLFGRRGLHRLQVLGLMRAATNERATPRHPQN